MKGSLVIKNTRLLSSTPPPKGGGGGKLFLDISDILNKRYSTGPIQNVDGIITNIFERYQDIL